MKKHGTDGKRQEWHKLHNAASSSGITEAEVIPNLLKQTHQKIRNISSNGAYGTKACHEVSIENAL